MGEFNESNQWRFQSAWRRKNLIRERSHRWDWEYRENMQRISLKICPYGGKYAGRDCEERCDKLKDRLGVRLPQEEES